MIISDKKYVEKIPLACLPTRIEKLEKTSAQYGKNIFIKRDDQTGTELSGNKIRKLEYAVAEARGAGERASIIASFENAKKPHTYTYRVENYDNRLNTEESYVSGTPWYRQPGKYSFWSNSGSGIQNVSISGRVRNDGTYGVSIQIRKKDSPQDMFDTWGCKGNGDITAKNHGGKQITVTVTDNGSGKVEVTSTGEVSCTKELTFRGGTIPHNPLEK